MAYPKPFAKITWLFTILGTDEVAETSLHVSTLGSAPFDANAFVGAWTGAYAAANVTRMVSVLTAGSSDILWANYSSIVGLKVAAFDVNGAYTRAPYVYDAPTPPFGTKTPVQPESSVCLSLRSGSFFGTSNYGRMYLPHTAMPLSSASPYAPPGSTLAIATAAASMITQINTDSNGMAAGAGVVNISQKAPGSVKGVAQVLVGDVVDTQRRRRNKLQETYAAHAV